MILRRIDSIFPPQKRAWRGRAQLSGLLPLVVVAAMLGVAGCGTTRADPPPYPQVSARSGFQPAWTYGAVGKSTAGFEPAIVADTIWVAANDGRLSIIEAEGGKLRARVDLRAALAAAIGTDGTLQVVVTRDGVVIALDRQGKEQWRSSLGAEIVAVPSVGDSIVVVRTVDGRIIALDRESGSAKWTWRQQQLPALTLRQSAGVVLDSEVVYAGLPAGRVVALDQRLGAPRWETVTSSSRGATELERLIDISGPPVLDGDRVCAIAYQGRVACLRTSDGRILWTRDIQSGTGIAMKGNQIFTVDGSDLVRGFVVNGDDLWKQDAYVRRTMSRPVIEGDRLLLTDRYGSLHVIDATNGAPIARVEADGSGFTSQPIVSGALAFAQTVGGSLMALPLK